MPFPKGQQPKGSTPFKPGQTGNPNGRPKKLPNLEKLLANVLGKEDDGGITEAEKILTKLSDQAKNGNVRASEIIMDRAWGKPKQFVENINTNINSDMTEEQLNDRIAQLFKKSSEYDSDTGTDQ